MYANSHATYSARRLVAAIGVAMLIAGCSSYSGSGLKSGISNQNDTRASMGEPAAVHRAATGADHVESWEYPRGPAGRHTFMARFDAQGKLVRIDQVLTAATLRALRIGQDTRDDVRRLLGRPAFVRQIGRDPEVWDYAAIASTGYPRLVRILVTFNGAGVVTGAGEMEEPEATTDIM
jgi:SmpA / OmlA family